MDVKDYGRTLMGKPTNAGGPARRRSVISNVIGVVGLALALVFGGACDSLLEVDLPGQVSGEALGDPGLAPILVSGAIADFECAYAVYVARTGLLTGEFITSAGWRAINEVAARLVGLADGGSCEDDQSSPDTPTYGPLHRARFQAEDAYSRITEWSAEKVPDRDQLLGTAAAYAGYALTLLGEGYCEIAIDGGPALSREDAWRLAEERFTAAIQHAEAANDNAILDLARVGRGRVRLNLGQMEDAAADAEEVAEGFVHNATYSLSTPRRHNRVHSLNQPNNFISVAPSFRDLQVDGVPDSRVEVADGNRNGHDGVTRMFYAQKHPALDSPIPMASWREAQLIVAEGRGGQVAAEAINRLRATADLPTFSGSTSDEIVQQVIEERRRELFAQGHRINDLLRLNLSWPQGSTHKGEPFGTVTCLPLPDDERLNNPNF